MACVTRNPISLQKIMFLPDFTAIFPDKLMYLTNNLLRGHGKSDFTKLETSKIKKTEF